MRRPALTRKRSSKGRRRLQFETLERRYVLSGQAVLVNDAFSLHQNGPQTPLDVLANDIFDADYAGPRQITSVSFGDQGGRIEIAAEQKSILYTPPADYFGMETFVYAVDGQRTARVTVNVQGLLAFDEYVILPDGIEHTLDVLANDPFWEGYAGQRLITSVSVGSAGGTITIAPDGKSVIYKPLEGARGKESFIYVVDDVYPAQVTINIPATLKDDKFGLVEYDPPKTLNVLANDPFWAGYSGPRQITHVTQGELGASVEIASDGKSIRYTASSFGYDTLTYVVDGKYEASVTAVVHRPVREDWFEVDENSIGFNFNVTQNDYYYDLNHNWRDVIESVTAVTQSENGGAVAISADGQGVLYTPAADFQGTDKFSYIADGVHMATVTVQVTRPVRDDYILPGAVQDSPNYSLDVLANDFLGNGYSGPQIITAVGPTEHGGVVTIRSDGKALLYTPAEGYTGYDKFTYTVDGELEATVTVYVRPLVADDSARYCPNPAHAPYAIAVLANDRLWSGYTGPGVITGATLIEGNGQVSIQDGARLLFDPAGAGSHTIRYTVDGKYEATVIISVPNHADPDHLVVDQNSGSHGLDVLTNDFDPDPYYVECKAQDYPGPRVITAVTQSQHGGTVTIAADGLSVTYEPPVDFYGVDTFTYTIDNFMTGTVTVDVIRRVRDDQFRVDAADGPQSLPVLANDLFGANYAGTGRITAVTATSNGGTATIAEDGHSIMYTTAAGLVGTDTFTYTVDGVLKAEVRVIVDAPAGEQNQKFGSVEEFAQFLIDDGLERYAHLFGKTAWFSYIKGDGAYLASDMSPQSGSTNVRNHSETNVQVAGVDEGDIVEFDSDYIYMLTGGELVILDAWPAEELSIASRFGIEGRPVAQFLHGDRLTVISQVGGYNFPIWGDAGRFNSDIFTYTGQWSTSTTIVTVLDVSDRTAPTVVQRTEMDGRYVDARGVGDYVYVMVNNGNAAAPSPQIVDDDNDPATPGRYETAEEYAARLAASAGEIVEAALPNYTTYGPDGEMIRTGLLNTPADIYRPLVAGADNLISVVSFNVESDEPGLTDTSAVYSTGASTIYASLENFYVFDHDRSAEDGTVTRIVKFDWAPETGGVEYVATTTVAGTILNQFSADESDGYLRIATTARNDRSGNWSGRAENMLFVLQEDDGVFEFVGGLQNLGLDETMRSVRFMGDRAFVVTFREIDPLFAIDLSDPSNPEAVGHITLPGFSTYMHLIDANHLLTVGRNTPGGANGPTQVSLFDISDLLAPRRIAEYTFSRFSTSEAELDHHAFGYYAEFGLLGMPITREFRERVDEDGDGYRESSRWVREHALAVFSVDADAADPAARLILSGQIDHDSPVRRSGYIGDKLYSVANDSVKVVDVSDLDTVIGEVVVGSPAEPIGSLLYLPISAPIVIDSITSIRFGDYLSGVIVASPPAVKSDGGLALGIERARADLAQRLQVDAGVPLLVTAEAAPDAPGRGYELVLRVGDEYYRYRSAECGMAELMDGDFQFDAALGAWHAVEPMVTIRPPGLRGDYNGDDRVDMADFAVYRATFGQWSATEFLAADGNGDGQVNSGDYSVWRNNLGAIAGDYNKSGVVDAGDYSVWRNTVDSTTDLRADGNNDGVVSRADYHIWKLHFGETRTSQPAAGNAMRQSSVPSAASIKAQDLALLQWKAAGQAGLDAADGDGQNAAIDYPSTEQDANAFEELFAGLSDGGAPDWAGAILGSNLR
ncbi:MAG: beta-propeller domain-containing protein [Pirellulales bacterium]